MFNTQLPAVSSELTRLQNVVKQAAKGLPQVQTNTQSPQVIGGIGKPVVVHSHQGNKLNYQA